MIVSIVVLCLLPLWTSLQWSRALWLLCAGCMTGLEHRWHMVRHCRRGFRLTKGYCRAVLHPHLSSVSSWTAWRRTWIGSLRVLLLPSGRRCGLSALLSLCCCLLMILSCCPAGWMSYSVCSMPCPASVLTMVLRSTSANRHGWLVGVPLAVCRRWAHSCTRVVCSPPLPRTSIWGWSGMAPALCAP